jgi:hypothetical protein
MFGKCLMVGSSQGNVFFIKNMPYLLIRLKIWKKSLVFTGKGRDIGV